MDKEKVINGLHCCCHTDGSNCAKCPYDIANSDCTALMSMDALELLKEQKPIEPTFRQDEDGVFVWACGSCGAYMYHIYDGIDKAKEYAKYCRQCGKKVKWNG